MRASLNKSILELISLLLQVLYKAHAVSIGRVALLDQYYPRISQVLLGIWNNKNLH
jgi:hypothetical protein